MESTPRPGFDPLPLFLADLQVCLAYEWRVPLTVLPVQSMFADTLKFFADPLGGDRIGAIWLPGLDSPRSFRALAGFSSKPLLKVCRSH
jgi:U3 small nucleolar RNA-associated protein 22